MLDLAPWLNPITGPNPSGASLRDLQGFHELERLMTPRVEVARDERNNPVSQTQLPVDWAAVLEKAEELRDEGRDLRLLVIVTRALVNQRGLRGLADGLTLIARTLDTHWDTTHPELRPSPSPRDAALRRINALMQVQNDEDGALGDLRRAAFFEPRGLGPVTGRDLERAMLDVQSVLNEAPALATAADKAALAAAQDALLDRVNRACRAQADADPSVLAELLAAARGAGAALAELGGVMTARLGSEIPLPQLGRFLDRVTAALERAVGAPKRAAEPEAPRIERAEAERAPRPVGNGGALPDRLTTREEVTACLDRIIEFYDRTEPASPVPFLARRMRRMVPMDFLELMEDLAPSGLKEFRALAGLGDDKKNAARTQGEKT